MGQKQNVPSPKSLLDTIAVISKYDSDTYIQVPLQIQPLMHKDTFGDSFFNLFSNLHQPDLFRLLFQKMSISTTSETISTSLFTKDRFGRTVLHQLVSMEQFFDGNYVDGEYWPDIQSEKEDQFLEQPNYRNLGSKSDQNLKPNEVTKIARQIFQSIDVPYIDDYNIIEFIPPLSSNTNLLNNNTRHSSNMNPIPPKVNNVDPENGITLKYYNLSPLQKNQLHLLALQRGCIVPTPKLTFQRQIFLRFGGVLNSMVPDVLRQTNSAFKLETNDKTSNLFVNHRSTLHQFLLFFALICKHSLVPKSYLNNVNTQIILTPGNPDGLESVASILKKTQQKDQFDMFARQAHNNVTNRQYYDKHDHDEWLYEYMPPLIDIESDL
jgi:hypothetical protein